MNPHNRNDQKNQENRPKNPETANNPTRTSKPIDPNMDPKNRPQMRSEQDQRNTNKNPTNRTPENNNPNNPKKRY